MNKKINFYDIYDYYYQPFWQKSYFKWFVLFFLLIIFVLSFYFLFNYLKKRKQNVAPWQWAFEKLNTLSLKKNVDKKDFKNFYFDLTSIIKIYLQKRFNWFVQDKTDDELIRFLQENNFDENLLKDLKEISNNSLWVKFADETVLKTQADQDLKLVYNLIEKTKIQSNKKS